VPAWLLAVKPGAVATPLASVTTVAVAFPGKRPPGPLAGALKGHLDPGHRVAELVHDAGLQTMLQSTVATCATRFSQEERM
jgi:hypothetical protein